MSQEGRFPFHARLGADDTAFLGANGSTNEIEGAVADTPCTVITVRRSLKGTSSYFWFGSQEVCGDKSFHFNTLAVDYF